MINNILFADDGSATSNKALVYVKNFALKFNSRVKIIHIYTSPVIIPSMDFGQITPIYTNDIEENFKQKGTEILIQVEKEFEDSGIETSIQLIRGESVGSTIIEMCNSGEFDLLVLGKHLKTRWEKFLMGSTSGHITHSVKCPVLLVNEKATF